MFAAWNNSKKVAKMLVNAEADLKKFDNEKKSAAMLARIRQNYTIMNIYQQVVCTNKMINVL